nr:OpgC domain-containing protein [Methylomonas koyamae]
MESTLVPAQPRNRRLDFFRGVALLVIFVNHMPGNPWFWYTPSRFGFSDSAEIFVFLSGYVSAVAYGRCFGQAGLALGSVRVFLRCAQIYAAHLASFLAMAAICVFGNRWLPGTDYIQQLNIAYFFNDTQQAVFDLFALAYVPNYFDILPLYLVLLAWVPLAWSLSLVSKYLALAASLLVYALAWYYGLELSGEPNGGRHGFLIRSAGNCCFFPASPSRPDGCRNPAIGRVWLGPARCWRPWPCRWPTNRSIPAIAYCWNCGHTWNRCWTKATSARCAGYIYWHWPIWPDKFPPESRHAWNEVRRAGWRIWGGNRWRCFYAAWLCHIWAEWRWIGPAGSIWLLRRSTSPALPS